MASKLGEIYVPSGAAELRDQWLSDYRLAAIEAGVSDPPVGPGTDPYILATAQANISLIQLHNLRISEDNGDVLSATGAALDEIRQADGLPEVSPTGSSGKVVVTVTGGGTTTITDGQPVILPNGSRAHVVGTHVGVGDQDEVSVAAETTGEATNFAGGAKVRFITPPINVATDAVVSVTSPLTGGTDEEDDARKRDRILNKRRNVPAGGNWGHLRQTIFDNVGDIQDVFIYPALGGPGSTKVVCVKDFDVANADYSRTPTSDQLNRARSFLQANLPGEMEVVVQGAEDLNANVSLLLSIPASSQAGGNGKGWVDAVPWPALEVADGGSVVVNTVTSSTEIVVSANTATAPTAGQTHVAWWSVVDRKFHKRLVVAVAGSAGAWELELDSPLVDSTGAVVQVGDYICPDAVSIEAYGESWIETMRGMGPGENTNDANRIPRALRRPFVADESPSTLGVLQLTAMVNRHAEISDLAYGFTPAAPSVPGSVDSAPQVLRPMRFGVWEQ